MEAHVAASPALGLLLLVAAGATLAVIAFTPMPLWARGACGFAVAVAALDSVRTVALRLGRRGVRAFRVDLARGICVCDGAGHWREGRVQEGSFVAPWLTIVRWRPAGARFDRTFLIVPAMLDAETFRRLRVLLRWQ